MTADWRATSGEPGGGDEPSPDPAYSPPPGGPYPPPPGGPYPAYGPPPSQQPVYPGYPPGYAGYPGYPAPVVYQSRTSGMAIASLVLGILWMYWIGSVLALIFGYIAIRDIDRSGGIVTGRGMAVAGIVLGWIGVGLLGLIFLVALVGSAAAATASS